MSELKLKLSQKNKKQKKIEKFHFCSNNIQFAIKIVVNFWPLILIDIYLCWIMSRSLARSLFCCRDLLLRCCQRATSWSSSLLSSLSAAFPHRNFLSMYSNSQVFFSSSFFFGCSCLRFHGGFVIVGSVGVWFLGSSFGGRFMVWWRVFCLFFFFFFFFFRGLCPELLSLLRRNFVGMWWCQVRRRRGAWWWDSSSV